MLTKKDFKKIATIINDNRMSIDGRIFLHFDLTDELCDYLATKNPAFDREKFLAACGV